MAYTKYSLTPSNNTATPPDGAPEGMLPSAVNDTMRDMMAQIRDCGDGIRDGTYTMTAPKITGGTITGVAFTGNTFTSPVISGGSINNTPIGASTANTGAFTTLSATGVTTVQAGTNSAPAITTSGDTNTGIFFPAADTIAFTEGGVEAMRITSAGNVGIGTSSPNGKFDISAGGAATFEFIPNYVGTGANRIQSYNRSTSAYATLQYDAADHRFETSATERMRIDSSGNVGIGTSSPSSRLHVTQSDANNGTIKAESNTSNEYAGVTFFNGATSKNAGSRNYQIANNYSNFGNFDILSSTTNTGNPTVPRVTIDSSGNVGIGLTTGGARLAISGGSLPSVGGFNLGISTGLTTGRLGTYDSGSLSSISNATDAQSLEVSVGSTGGYYAGISMTGSNATLNSGTLRFATAGNERMRIDSSGNLLVGSTTTQNNNRLYIQSNNFMVGINGTNTTGEMVRFYSNGSTAGTISYTASTVAYNTSSDYRLKENIVPMTGALAKVAQLKPVTYTWKVDGSAGQGFIAHELQAVVPDAVTGEKDAVDENGKPIYQGIDTSFLVATLTAALQEAHGLIKDLQARVDALESK